MKQNQYKNYQNTLKLWCFTKWENCYIICADFSKIDSADVIVRVSNKKIGFVFFSNKTNDFLKQQIINCQKLYDKVTLVTNNINFSAADVKTFNDNVGLLNISNAYGFGNVIQEIKI